MSAELLELKKLLDQGVIPRPVYEVHRAKFLKALASDAPADQITSSTAQQSSDTNRRPLFSSGELSQTAGTTLAVT